jgi:anti-sigma-K factor RskA
MGREDAGKSYLDGSVDGPDQALAADLVLGVLTAADRQAAEQRAVADPEFARLVAAFRQRLEILPEPIEPVTPHEAVWDHIATRIAPKG